MTKPQENKTNSEDSLIIIGQVIKPFGLTGELKVKPETFDIERHSLLKSVQFKKHPKSSIIELQITKSRIMSSNWLINFKGYNTPETAKALSGGLIYILSRERLPLPEGKIYHSDAIGMQVFNTSGDIMGTITNVLDQTHQKLLEVTKGSKVHMVPWNNQFVKAIKTKDKAFFIDYSMLEGLYEI